MEQKTGGVKIRGEGASSRELPTAQWGRRIPQLGQASSLRGPVLLPGVTREVGRKRGRGTT